MKACTFLGLAAGTIAVATGAATADLVSHLAVDNYFDLYISTDDSVQGTYIGFRNWQVTTALTAGLTPGVTNYIHARVGGDGSTIEAFLGQFNVDSSFVFDNGQQQLTTDLTHWRESSTGWGNYNLTPYMALYDGSSTGTNGSSPWGVRPDIAFDATWLGFDLGSTRYFSTTLTAVPLPPAAFAGISTLAGVAAMGVVRRRRNCQA